MNSRRDVPHLRAQAQDHLRRAEFSLTHQEYAVVVHYAQLALEISAKTIISYYYEPHWSHDPSGDLLNVIRANGKTLEQRLGKATVRAMRRLATDAKQYAPWHTWSTYGLDEPDEAYQSPDDLCTAAVVADLMPRARHAIAFALRFADLFA